MNRVNRKVPVPGEFLVAQTEFLKSAAGDAEIFLLVSLPAQPVASFGWLSVVVVFPVFSSPGGCNQSFP